MAFRAALRATLSGPPPSPRSNTTDALPLSAGAALHLADSSEDDHRIDLVNKVWGGKNDSWSGPAKQWLSHPMVQERLNRRASGHSNLDAYGHLKVTLIEMGWTLPVPRAASLCCGEGSLERELLKQGYAQSIIGYDLAKDAIGEARRLAEAGGLTDLKYEVRDLEHSGLSETGLDVVFALSGLHHLSQLENTFDAVHAALRPGGVFHVHEYVGPDRFQWTERQLQEINSFLERLPERYHRLPDGSLKPRVTRPTIQEMLDVDPSEAVRSSDIEPLLAERFDILDRRELGGTLLHMALSNIAQNFDPEIAEDRFWMMELFTQEDRLLEEGAISSDFMVVTARRP